MFRKKNKQQAVYLDHAATTAVSSAVFTAMLPYFSEQYGNPSALYSLAGESHDAVEKARQNIATMFAAQPDTIFFTSGGTESDNMAILGVARKHASKGKHIITTAIEHHAVLGPCHYLASQGFEVTYLPVDEHGKVTAAQVAKALRPDTILVSVMYANNEVGTIEPLADIGRELLKWRKKQKTVYPYFHTDACQAAGSLSLHVEKLHVDLMTMNGSKVYGPKGVGVLYKRRGIEIEPLVYGGGQEMQLRSGTENVPGIVGLATALMAEQDALTIAEKRDALWHGIKDRVAGVTLNGPACDEGRLVNNIHISIEGVDAEALVLYLSAKGIFVGTGSACATGRDEGSHVLTAMGKTEDDIASSIRLTVGKDTTQSDIEYVLAVFPKVVAQVRRMNALSA